MEEQTGKDEVVCPGYAMLPFPSPRDCIFYPPGAGGACWGDTELGQRWLFGPWFLLTRGKRVEERRQLTAASSATFSDGCGNNLMGPGFQFCVLSSDPN